MSILLFMFDMCQVCPTGSEAPALTGCGGVKAPRNKKTSKDGKRPTTRDVDSSLLDFICDGRAEALSNS